LGRKRKGRDISGIMVVDKPAGMTSNAVLQHVKRIYGAAKAGHTGALDPIATGVLPLCLGEATKFSQRLLESDKRYITRIQLGESRDTADIEGAVLDTASIPELSSAGIEAVLQQFKGPITQVPPMYSALKHQGKKLYELAREGKDFDIKSKAREVVIHDIKLLDFADTWIDLDVTCSKGTYIRSLAEDVATALGSLGYVARLRRLAAGPYNADMMYSLQQLETLKSDNPDSYHALDSELLPIHTALPDVPMVTISLKQAYDLQFGRAITVSDAGGQPMAQVQLRLLHEQWDLLLGVGELNADGVILPKRLLNIPELAQILASANLV